MKKLILYLIVAGTSCSAFQSHAIEGLTIQPQNGNIVLTWPSTSASTYIVQYRDAFDTNHPWQTLQSGLSGDDGTTSYTDPGRFPIPPAGGSGQTMATRSTTLATDATATDTGIIMPPLPPGMTLGSDGTVTLAPMGRMATAYAGLPSPGPIGQSNTNPPVPPTYRFYRVVATGFSIIGVNNGDTVSGTISIAVEYGDVSGDVSTLTLNDDNGSIAPQLCAPFTSVPTFTIDTTQMSNGVHQIYASASWSVPSQNDDGSTETLCSIPITINVSNEISFPAWLPEYGDYSDYVGNALFFSATSAHAVAGYMIDVYNGEDSYIGTWQGQITNGLIQFWWDLNGPGGLPVPNNQAFTFVVTTSYAAGTSSAVAPKTYKQTDPWIGIGDWVVANQQAWENYLGAENLDTVADSFVQAAQADGSLTVRPTPNVDTAFRINFGSGYSDSTRNSQWSTFRSALYDPNSRNLFYLGHGAFEGLGASGDTNKFITASEIAGQLHTIPIGQTNRHAFRFVFLDRCATSDGRMPEAFGIQHKEGIPLSTFYSSSKRPCTFVGWNTEKWIGIQNNVVLDDHWKFVQYFQLNWITHGVKSAFDIASKKSDVQMIHYSTLKIFGYPDLPYNSFNR